MKCFRYGILLVLLSVLLISATPVYADTNDPDSAPTVEQINWYRNLLETDDRVVIWLANIPYAAPPSTRVTETFEWILLDTDDTTELGRTTGFAFNEDGYGYNVYAMYFSAADAIDWDETYTLRLVGNPAVFDTPPQYNYPINLDDYTDLTDSVENKIALSARILELGADLDNRWGLSASLSLLLAGDAGTVLSLQGESFFRGVILGCQSVAPYAFRVIIVDMDAPDRDWEDGYSENLTGLYDDTWIAPAKTAGGAIFGVEYDLMSIILIAGLCCGLMYLNWKITNDQWNALIDVAIVLVAAPRLDLIPLTFTALVCAMAAIYTGMKVKSFVG